MTYEELRTEYVATMRKIKATDHRLPEWDRLWDHIYQIMYEWITTRNETAQARPPAPRTGWNAPGSR